MNAKQLANRIRKEIAKKKIGNKKIVVEKISEKEIKIGGFSITVA
jgi:hypothetical protein